MWICGQKGVFLPHVFFLLCTLHNFDKKVWTGGPVMKIMKKSYNLFYFHFWKCGHLWMKLSFISYFLSFFLVPFIFLQKSVDRWTSKKISEKKHQSLIAWQSSAAKPDPIYGVEHHGQKTGSVGLGWPSGSKFRLGWGFFIRTYFWVEPASTPQPETFLFLCIP